MQTLFVAACPFCALARIVADIFCHSEQGLRIHGPHVHLQRLCALLACVAGALHGQCITLTELGRALPSPQMHTAERWDSVVARMVWRMQGKGNLGGVMKEMMDQVEAPTDREIAALTDYLKRHGQGEMDPRHPALGSEAGKMFTIACTQCHALPDPRRHTPREWPGVVERMKRHMAWANTVVGPDSLKTNPVLDTAEIVLFLQRYARAQQKAN